jgi:hypothetical protein
VKRNLLPLAELDPGRWVHEDDAAPLTLRTALKVIAGGVLAALVGWGLLTLALLAAPA